MSSEASIHNHFLEAAFQDWLACEDRLSVAKSELDKATILLTNAKNGAEFQVEKAKAVVEKMMAETGEYELFIPESEGSSRGYRVGWSTPRQSVKIVNADAVPDDLCKIERKPKLKEIGDLLKAGLQTNYAALEYGEKKLQYKWVKKGE